jgi:hypothetical protein
VLAKPIGLGQHRETRGQQQVQIEVRSVNAGAAIAVCICTMLLLSACSSEITPERAAAAYPPQPVIFPPQPPVPPAGNSPNGVRAEFVRWFSSAGYKDFQIEALAEHAKTESGFRPCASAPGFRYTFQWGGRRLQRLQEFAGSGSSCPPLEKQLAFADTELRNEPAYSCFWEASTKAAAVAALRRGFGRGSC